MCFLKKFFNKKIAPAQCESDSLYDIFSRVFMLWLYSIVSYYFFMSISPSFCRRVTAIYIKAHRQAASFPDQAL